jgi:hypothetical protein
MTPRDPKLLKAASKYNEPAKLREAPPLPPRADAAAAGPDADESSDNDSEVELVFSSDDDEVDIEEAEQLHRAESTKQLKHADYLHFATELANHLGLQDYDQLLGLIHNSQLFDLECGFNPITSA